jgi:hypothetical protein
MRSDNDYVLTALCEADVILDDHRFDIVVPYIRGRLCLTVSANILMDVSPQGLGLRRFLAVVSNFP